MNQRRVPNKKSPPWIPTVFLGLFIVYVFTLGNPPQCPDHYTQAQIDASQGLFSGCIVGANIGLGMLIPFLLILVVYVLVRWVRYLLSRNR